MHIHLLLIGFACSCGTLGGGGASALDDQAQHNWSNVESQLVDHDGDGYPAGFDCDDTDADIHPYAVEDCTDGRDNDCDGGADCDDQRCQGVVVCPEVCDDGVDNDLDGLLDCEDGECAGACVSVQVTGGDLRITRRRSVHRVWGACVASACGTFDEDLWRATADSVTGRAWSRAEGSPVDSCTWTVGRAAAHTREYQAHTSGLGSSPSRWVWDVDRSDIADTGCEPAWRSALPDMLAGAREGAGYPYWVQGTGSPHDFGGGAVSSWYRGGSTTGYQVLQDTHWGNTSTGYVMTSWTVWSASWTQPLVPGDTRVYIKEATP